METEEHAQRIKEYCFAIAKEMMLSPKELDDLALLAMLHDIGKVGMKESILQKPGPLSDEEWAEVKKHSRKLAGALPKIHRNLHP